MTRNEIEKRADIAFKRKINKKGRPAGRSERTFVKCKKCNTRAYYDYIPYSLSNPIIVTSCGHGFEYYNKF